MPYPQQTFNSFNDLQVYINTYWVTNGVGDITGIVGNNVVNALLTFIEESPLNYGRAKVISTGGSVLLDRPVNVINGTPPSTVSFGDNIYNEFTIVNMTAANIPLAAGVTYYDVNSNIITYIPRRQVLSVSKAENNLWIQTNNFSTNGGSVTFPKIYINVGNDSPQQMIPGQIAYTIDNNKIDIDSVAVTIDGVRIYPDVVGQVSVDIMYNVNNVVITFLNPSIDNPGINFGVQQGWKIIIDYAASTI